VGLQAKLKLKKRGTSTLRKKHNKEMTKMELLSKSIFGRNNVGSNKLTGTETLKSAVSATSVNTNDTEQTPIQKTEPKKGWRAWLRDKWNKAREIVAEAEPFFKNIGKIAITMCGAAIAYMRARKKWKALKKWEEEQDDHKKAGMCRCVYA
jgi:hypothetical protein